jgi:hypothetical protein
VADWREEDPSVADAVRRLLTDRGALSENELLAELETAGLDLGGDPKDTLEAVFGDDELGLVVSLADGR